MNIHYKLTITQEDMQLAISEFILSRTGFTIDPVKIDVWQEHLVVQFDTPDVEPPKVDAPPQVEMAGPPL
jgi:hypothetical protein